MSAEDEPGAPAEGARGRAPKQEHRILKLRFNVPVGLTEDEIHELGERIVTADAISSEDVTFDGTEVIDES